MNNFIKYAKISKNIKDFLRKNYKAAKVPYQDINNRSKIEKIIINDLKKFLSQYPLESTDSRTLETIADIYEERFKETNPKVYKYGDIYDKIENMLWEGMNEQDR